MRIERNLSGVPEATPEQIIECQERKITIFKEAFLAISERHEKLLADYERATGMKWEPAKEPAQSIIDQINSQINGGDHGNG